jgi:hypothetical protein
MGIDDALIEAYEDAEYEIFGESEIIIHIGEVSLDLKRLMLAKQSHAAAFISAHNPYSEILEESENIKRHNDLLNDLKTLGFDTVLGEGRDKQGQWLGEASLLIFNISRTLAESLGNQYGQNAIVWIEADAIPQLVLLDGKKAGN